jgi:cell division topological specificity factor
MDLFSFFKKKPASKDIAKSRLQFVLIQDRMGCSPEVLEMLKTDILKVIMKYVDVDEKEMDIQISPPGEGGTVNVPTTKH